MSAIHVFIISWRGQHNRAAHIAKSIDGAADNISIVYSDPDSAPEALNGHNLIHRDDSLYWADKFQACIEHCKPDEIMLVIHADCQCDDWPSVVTRCKAAFEKYADLGVWSPRLTGTPWRLERTRMRRIPDSNCSVVAQTDGIVFALSPSLYDRMKRLDYNNNLYGLGIDWLFICATYAQGKLAVVDEGILVRHCVTRGYSTEDARAQKRAFLTQMTPDEYDAYMRLKGHMHKRRIPSKILYFFERMAPRKTLYS